MDCGLHLAESRDRQALSQSRKTDKIASSEVARSRVDWNTFHPMIFLLLAVSSHAPAELVENSYARKTSGNDRVSCERRDRDRVWTQFYPLLDK
jgi:hypothetical protein